MEETSEGIASLVEGRGEGNEHNASTNSEEGEELIFNSAVNDAANTPEPG